MWLARDEALLQLQSGHRAEARAAAAGSLCLLAESEPARAHELAELLPSLLADRQPEVRRAGVALASMALLPEEAQGVLGRNLRDVAVQVRLEAVGRLADLARPESRGALTAALIDESFEVRFEAARGIAALGHSAGREVLLQALENNGLRFRAIGALADLGDKEAIPALRQVMGRIFASPFERTQAAGALAKLGDESGAEFLLVRTKRRWGADRAFAVELCGEVKVPGAFERLCEVLDNPKDSARGAAARGLGRLQDAKALPRLARLMDDVMAPEDVRLDAAEGLCLLGTPEARARVAAASDGWPSEPGRAELEEMLEEVAE